MDGRHQIERSLASRMPASPQIYARAGGILYLIVFALGFTLFAYPSISPSGNATLSVHVISSAQPWLRVVSTAELINFLCDVPLALIFYVLLAPVDRNIALLAAFFRLANAFLGAIIGLGRLAVLTLLGDTADRSAFTPTQLQALASLFLTLHGYGLDICFVFFGMHCMLLGFLIYRSDYLPKFLGVLLPIAGLIYLADSLVDIVAPAIADKVPTTIFLPGFIAELSLCLWLLAKGINLQKWDDKTSITVGSQMS